MPTIKRAHCVITGRVQGVFYRASTRDHARAYALDGWVRNRVDGRVEAVFEGDASAVNAMVAWCHKGPPAAHVDHVDISWETPTGEEGAFAVRT